MHKTTTKPITMPSPPGFPLADLPQELQREISVRAARSRAEAAESAITRYAPSARTAPWNDNGATFHVMWASETESPLLWRFDFWPDENTQLVLIQLVHGRGDASVDVAYALPSTHDANTGILTIRILKDMPIYSTELRSRHKLQTMIRAWYTDPKRYRDVMREMISGLRQQKHRLPSPLRVPRLIVSINDSDLAALRTGRRGPVHHSSMTSMPVDEFTRLLFRDFVDA